MENPPKKKLIIYYIFGFLIVLGILIGGYYFYLKSRPAVFGVIVNPENITNQQNQFVTPYPIFVTFKSGVSEAEAEAILKKYGDNALPLHYDLSQFSSLESATSPESFEFEVKGFQAFTTIGDKLKTESSVSSVTSPAP
jgi:hypothetical protein